MRILLDVDGVLADFVTPALAIINEISARTWLAEDIEQHDLTRACGLTPEQSKRWYAAICAPGFCANLQPYPGVVEILTQLREKAELVAVTAPFDNGTDRAAPHWMIERWDWLRAHGFGPRQIIFTNEKSYIDGDIFVDDNAHHVDMWKYRHPQKVAGLQPNGYLLTRPWNWPDRDLDSSRIMTLDWLVETVAKI